MFRGFSLLVALYVFGGTVLFGEDANADDDVFEGKPISVMASIHPLAMIAAAVLPPQIEVQTLMKSSASPHGHALRPSDIKRLHQVDVLVWVGPELENFLVKAAAQTDNLRTVTAFDVLELPAEERSHRHAEISHDHSSGHSETHIAEGGSDPHVWLDPESAIFIARDLVREVSKIKPELTASLQKNLQRFELELETLDHQMGQKLNLLSEHHFVVFHDAYSHLLHRYDLTHYRAFTLHPERRPGAKTVAELRQYVQDNKVECVFSEPQFTNTHQKLLRDLNIQRAELDPLGSNIQLNKDAYATMLSEMADTISGCLN